MPLTAEAKDDLPLLISLMVSWSSALVAPLCCPTPLPPNLTQLRPAALPISAVFLLPPCCLY